jgi:hypothetical protein
MIHPLGQPGAAAPSCFDHPGSDNRGRDRDFRQEQVISGVFVQVPDRWYFLKHQDVVQFR